MPELIDNFTADQAEKLKCFLAAPERPKGTMDYDELAGFLFAIRCAPEAVMPSEWMPVVSDDQEPEYRSEQEFQEKVGAILSLYNAVANGTGADQPRLPPGCQIDDDPMANFGPEAVLGRWATGFVRGHTWLEDAWEVDLPDGIEEELSTSVITLSFFANRQLAEALYTEAHQNEITSEEDKSFEEFTARILRLFPVAMANYAAIGSSIWQALMKLEQLRESAPGRNDPCPCGSGKKYKKCCLIA